MMSEPELAAERPWRPRISLVAALLLMTIAGMAVLLVQKWRESDAQRQEIGRLRAELGYLSIDNENKVYVKQIDVNEPDIRRFRIYLPKNRKFKLYFRTLTVPGRQPNETGSAWLATVLKTIKRGGNQNIPNGEFTFEVQTRRNAVPKEHWELACHVLGSGDLSVLGAPGLTDRRGWTITSDASLGKQQEMDPDDGLVLYSLREGAVKENKGRFTKIKPDDTVEAPGVILWIAPADDSKRT
jgi:hypothetical protein